jgi:uncharacterized protein (DUF2141 family)
MPTSIRRLAAALALTLASLGSQARAQPQECEGAPSATRLIISVDGVRSAHGLIVASLYGPDKRRFLADHQELVSWKAPAQMGSTTLCIYLPQPGPYEIAVFHDANSNGRVDRDFIGRPKEAYGFSNNVHPILHKPSLESARFDAAAGDTHLHIRLLYP